MGEYYENPEIKRSLYITLILALLSVLVVFFTFKIGCEKVKADYMDNNMAVIGKVVRANPELKDKIVSVITKGSSKEDVEYGKQALKSCGYSEDLNIGLIPELGKSCNNLAKSIIVCMICFFWGSILINNIEYIKIYKKIENLNFAAKNMLNSNFDTGIYENAEGVFAKLAYTFNNMRTILKNNFDEVKREKNFLADTLSDISHQIKTPISSLIIYNDILLNRNVDEGKQKEFLESSKNQLNRIEWLIKSLLKLARMDAGAIKFQIKNADMNKTAAESVEFLKAMAENSKVNLEFLPGLNEIMVKHDPKWVSEAIINIVKNAIEHTNSGGEVKVSTEKSQVCSRVIVKDNGNGIPEEEIRHVFERFYKGKSNKSPESVGIGLALSKSIIEGNGGIISVNSKVGSGTTFTITFL